MFLTCLTISAALSSSLISVKAILNFLSSFSWASLLKLNSYSECKKPSLKAAKTASLSKLVSGKAKLAASIL